MEYLKLIEYGVLGVIAIFFLRWVWWNTKRADEVLRMKDEYIERINEHRVEGAQEAIKAVNELTKQIDRLLDEQGKGGQRESTQDLPSVDG